MKSQICVKNGRLYSLDYKKNLNIMKDLNTQPITAFKENYRSNWNLSLKNPIPNAPLPTEKTKIFGKTLQRVTRAPNRPQGLKRLRLLLMMMMTMTTRRWHCIKF
jgi:hypothetical protein